MWASSYNPKIVFYYAKCTDKNEGLLSGSVAVPYGYIFKSHFQLGKKGRDTQNMVWNMQIG